MEALFQFHDFVLYYFSNPVAE